MIVRNAALGAVACRVSDDDLYNFHDLKRSLLTPILFQQLHGFSKGGGKLITINFVVIKVSIKLRLVIQYE